MKIFGWMQSKLNRRHDSKKPNSVSVNNHKWQEPLKEEFRDWPNELLAIGTFGNNGMNENSRHTHLQENLSPTIDHLLQLTPEEIGKLQTELHRILVHKQVGSCEDTESESTTILAPEKFSSTRSSPEESNSTDCCHEGSNSAVPFSGKDIRADNTTKAINKKSLSFLVKKVFACRSGSTPTIGLRDQVPESRMDKILRAILHKKIYPQNATANSTKKYLVNKHKSSTLNEGETNEKADNGSRWVRTDSEYIVLEI